MKRTILLLSAIAALAALLLAQREVTAPPPPDRFDMRSVVPLETSPGVYRQVPQSELQLMGDQGWELVAVTTWVIRNEERGPDMPSPRPVVTQAYPAYYFKRLRTNNRR